MITTLKLCLCKRHLGYTFFPSYHLSWAEDEELVSNPGNCGWQGNNRANKSDPFDKLIGGRTVNTKTSKLEMPEKVSWLKHLIYITTSLFLFFKHLPLLHRYIGCFIFRNYLSKSGNLFSSNSTKQQTRSYSDWQLDW